MYSLTLETCEAESTVWALKAREPIGARRVLSVVVDLTIVWFPTCLLPHDLQHLPRHEAELTWTRMVLSTEESVDTM